MAKIQIYSPEGEAVMIEAVDAREYVEHCGYTYVQPAAEAEDAEIGKSDLSANAGTSKTKATGKATGKAAAKTDTTIPGANGDLGDTKQAPDSEVDESGEGEV